MQINPLDVVTYPVALLAAAGSTAIQAGATGQKWCVVGCYLVPAAAGGTVQILSGATAITGIMLLPTTGLLIPSSDEPVWMARAAGDAFNIDPAAQNIDGWVNIVMLK